MRMPGQRRTEIFPGNIEAERAVLAAVMTNKAILLDAFAALTAEDFTDTYNREVFKAAAKLFESNEAVDMVTVSMEFRRRNGGETRFSITDIVNEGERFTAPTLTHIKALKEVTRRRRIAQALLDAHEKVKTGEIDDVISETIAELQRDSQTRVRKPVSLNKALVMAERRIQMAMEHKGVATGVPTGFKEFDAKMGGLHAGEVMVVGARPSLGKSALLGCLAVQTARAGFPSIIVNAEMELVDVATRLLAKESGLANMNLRRGRIEDNEVKPMSDAGARLAKLPVWLYDETRWEPIKAQITALKSRKPELALALIDYVQRVKVEPLSRDERRYEQIGRIAKDAKDLARDLGIAVVLAAQIGREVDREHREPQLSDIRESGDLEQDCDIASFLHCYKLKEEPWSRYWLIKKNRNGPLGNIHLRFKGDDVAYYDWED